MGGSKGKTKKFSVCEGQTAEKEVESPTVNAT